MIYLVFASIYTPTLISYPIVVFHFPVANILLFFFSCILFGRFFFEEISKKESRSLI